MKKYVEYGQSILSILEEYPILKKTINNDYFSSEKINELVGFKIANYEEQVTSELFNKILYELDKQGKL